MKILIKESQLKSLVETSIKRVLKEQKLNESYASLETPEAYEFRYECEKFLKEPNDETPTKSRMFRLLGFSTNRSVYDKLFHFGLVKKDENNEMVYDDTNFKYRSYSLWQDLFSYSKRNNRGKGIYGYNW